MEEAIHPEREVSLPRPHSLGASGPCIPRAIPFLTLSTLRKRLGQGERPLLRALRRAHSELRQAPRAGLDSCGQQRSKTHGRSSANRRAHSPCHPSPSPAGLGSPLSVGQRRLPPHTHSRLVREMCPRPVGFMLGGRRGPLSLLHSSPSPFSLRRPSPPGAPPACGRPTAGSFRRISVPTLGGPFRDPPSPTCIPAVPLPKRINPAPPSATSFTAEPRASLGSRRNRLQNARARIPLAQRAARRPSLRWLPGPPPSGLR